MPPAGLRLPADSLLALPEGAEGTLFAEREVLAFLVRTTENAVCYHHILDHMPDEECLDLISHLGVAVHVSTDEPFENRLAHMASRNSGGPGGSVKRVADIRDSDCVVIFTAT